MQMIGPARGVPRHDHDRGRHQRVDAEIGEADEAAQHKQSQHGGGLLPCTAGALERILAAKSNGKQHI
jgi:hypothetical protein